MKINKFEALKVLAKHLTRKMQVPQHQVDLSLIATSLSITLTPQYPLFKKEGLLDNEDRFDVDAIKEKLLQIFTYSPIFNLPMINSVISIKKEDAIAFINDLEKAADVEVIEALPNK